MIPKQEQPTLIDILANCLMEFGEGFEQWQEKIAKAQSMNSAQPGCSGWNNKCNSSRQRANKPCNTKANHFTVHIDTQSLDPSVISVKVEDNILEVRGKQEKTNDDGSYEYLELIKKIPLADNVLIEQLKCTVEQDGRLRVEAPLKPTEQQQSNTERIIPVTFVEKKKASDGESSEKKPVASSDASEVNGEDIAVD